MQPRENSLVNQEGQNLISLIHLNPVTELDDSIKRGLVAMIMPVEQLLGSDDFKEIPKIDATMEEGEYKVAEYFGVDHRWQCLLEQWEKKNQNILVSSNITSSYFLSNQKVEQTKYGSASSRGCIDMQQ